MLVGAGGERSDSGDDVGRVRLVRVLLAEGRESASLDRKRTWWRQDLDVRELACGRSEYLVRLERPLRRHHEQRLLPRRRTTVLLKVTEALVRLQLISSRARRRRRQLARLAVVLLQIQEVVLVPVRVAGLLGEQVDLVLLLLS